MCLIWNHVELYHYKQDKAELICLVTSADYDYNVVSGTQHSIVILVVISLTVCCIEALMQNTHFTTSRDRHCGKIFKRSRDHNIIIVRKSKRIRI